jgi:hypothetical protein
MKWYKPSCKMNNFQDKILEWIPYDQLNDIKEINKGNLAMAIWEEDGSLYYKDNFEGKEYVRGSNKTVTLKYLKTQCVCEFLNKV